MVELFSLISGFYSEKKLPKFMSCVAVTEDVPSLLLGQATVASNRKHQGLEWHRWLFAEVTNITSVPDDQFKTKLMPIHVSHNPFRNCP
jgi:hypothetical protein